MGQHLKVYNNQSWNHLNTEMLRIFKTREAETIKKMQAYEEAVAKER